MFATAGVLASLRAAGTLVAPQDDPFAPTATEAGTYLFNIGFIVAGTLGVMWMEVETLQVKLVRSATTDALTGLLNRAALAREFAREVSRVARDKAPFSLAMFDIDHFKRVNDTHGHIAGDRVLCAFAELLTRTVRTYDVAARHGGEEFVLLLPGTALPVAHDVVDRVRAATQALEVGPAGIRFTVSAGVATFGAHGDDFDSLLKAADVALYRAKASGRNRVVTAAR